MRSVAIQVAETMERNDFLTLMGCTQVNYVNQRGSRVPEKNASMSAAMRAAPSASRFPPASFSLPQRGYCSRSASTATICSVVQVGATDVDG